MYETAINQLNKKAVLSGELLCENPGEAMFFKIYPISEGSVNGYKRNTSPVKSYEFQFVRHAIKYLEGYDDDYDVIYDDRKTRIVILTIPRTPNDEELHAFLRKLPIKDNQISSQLFSESPLLNIDKVFLNEEGVSDSLEFLFQA